MRKKLPFSTGPSTPVRPEFTKRVCEGANVPDLRMPVVRGVRKHAVRRRSRRPDERINWRPHHLTHPGRVDPVLYPNSTRATFDKVVTRPSRVLANNHIAHSNEGGTKLKVKRVKAIRGSNVAYDLASQF